MSSELENGLDGIEVYRKLDHSDPYDMAKNLVGKFYQLNPEINKARSNAALCINEIIFAYSDIGHVSKAEFWTAVRKKIFLVSI